MAGPFDRGGSDASDRTDRVCPVCFRDILPSERVSYQHGELLHLYCYVGIPPLSSVLGRALGQQRERALCLPCLGEEFGLTEREVKGAVRELASTHRFRVDIDTCWRCREVRSTVRALRTRQ